MEEKFEDSCYIIEFEKSFDITVWDSEEVCKILKINIESFKNHIKQTGNRCSDFGYKKSFNINFIKNQEEYQITTIGMYLFIKYRFKKEIELLNYFKEMAIIDLLRYQGYKQNTPKKTKGPGKFTIEIKSK
ncbi:hypothetical protein [uncultured Polaribacter sp.]|uniref:hypothetical protein n=1 Tax=uncultured Polaribacter sp. TaxID=174711 RepID=UPI00262338BD|nr:hypothetical protein [uncultured Polaribacter sp.]